MTPPDEPTATAPRHAPTPGLHGWITHTDLASADPAATKAWAAKVPGRAPGGVPIGFSGP